MDTPGHQNEIIHDEEQRLDESARRRHGISHTDASATEQLELLSIADFDNFSRVRNVTYLRRAILHGISAVGTTPPDHPEGAARLKRLQVRISSSFDLLHPPTAISQAASWELMEVLQLLLEMGADVNLRADASRKTLHLATKNGHEAVVRVLLRRGVDINTKDIDGRTALHLAAEQGHEAIVRLLCGNGADVHAKMNAMLGGVCCGATALHFAAWQGNEVMVRALLGIGADIDEEDRWDARTALHIAAIGGHEAVVRLLVESGAAVDGSPNNARGTPLIDAATNGHEAVVRLLLSKGANVDIMDSGGNPALRLAASNGHEAVVRLLLDHGADPTARGGSGRTARWFAAEKGHQAVVQLLLERGGADQDGPDMKNDADEGLGNVADGRLLEHIERAQQIMFHESEIQHWAQNLRFVVLAVDSDDSDYDLELIESSAGDEETENEPYVAVSYCWGRKANEEGTPLRIQVPSKNQNGAKEARDVRASSNILRRSLAFAATKGIKKVWIDQECVHQDDEEDRKMAIQCMHLVYRQAAITLIVLGDHVRTLEDVHAIPYITQHGVHEELRDRILGDRWFSRAWTTQEYANSAREKLSYLVGWKDGMDVSGDTWQLEAAAFNARLEHPRQNVRREWELHDGHIFAMAFMSMRHTQVMLSVAASHQLGASALSQRTSGLLDQNIEAKGWWKGDER
jgi:ankyrin repeat protein